jgi:hypothetical protein
VAVVDRFDCTYLFNTQFSINNTNLIFRVKIFLRSKSAVKISFLTRKRIVFWFLKNKKFKDYSATPLNSQLDNYLFAVKV